MQAKKLFWWLEGLDRTIWTPFWWIFPIIIVFWFPILRIWWWFFLPIFLFFPAKKYYLWWISWDFQYFERTKWVLLELTPPKEVLAPLIAMEDVFNVVWSVIDKANWREIWCEGEFKEYPYWCSWEIASIEGNIHFYVRCLPAHRHVVEAVFYSHYPEVEIHEVPDYTKTVPLNIPNEGWDMYGEDYILGKEDSLPIKTYSKFFEPQGEKISQEEKRIDPEVSLLEGMGRLKPGEQIWMQYVTTPIEIEDTPIAEESVALINKLARREEEKPPGALQEVFSLIFKGVPAGYEKKIELEEETKSGGGRDKVSTVTSKSSVKYSQKGEKKEIIPSEMKLTPGERESLVAVEDKVKKLFWKTHIRGVYVAKRSSWKKENRLITRAYFSHFASNSNYVRFWSDTRPKVHFVLRERRRKYRQKRMFRNYIMRLPPKFPKMTGPGNNFYNSEELATMWHFPIKITSTSVPTAAYVEAKKGGPPANLPVEE